MGLRKLDKSELKELGKAGFIYKQVVGKASYVSGFPELDSKIDVNSLFHTPLLVNFRKRTAGLEISILHGLKQYITGIKNEHIKSISIEDKDQIYEHKEKSIIGRAIVGGLILGPVGAIVGGMTGIGTKKVALPTPDLFLSINYGNENGEDAIFICACKHKDKSDIYSFFIKEYQSLFKLER